ncbi:hypothetical protein [endosymbiont GvMRE of Glomus versiforme]|uniref:hypothetical protein n=1 Tax=endosymbiont GvMRE of Glomus versiforme TaxID=2039283 RepID=UPI0011C394A3|nr:hypothetical protein [endosymbiont GvMRE of Glomus versiforme]
MKNLTALQNAYQQALKVKELDEKQLNHLIQDIKKAVRQFQQWQKTNYYQQLEQQLTTARQELNEQNQKIQSLQAENQKLREENEWLNESPTFEEEPQIEAKVLQQTNLPSGNK